jgi:hypothetical protein
MGSGTKISETRTVAGQLIHGFFYFNISERFYSVSHVRLVFSGGKNRHRCKNVPARPDLRGLPVDKYSYHGFGCCRLDRAKAIRFTEATVRKLNNILYSCSRWLAWIASPVIRPSRGAVESIVAVFYPQNGQGPPFSCFSHFSDTISSSSWIGVGTTRICFSFTTSSKRRTRCFSA